MFFITARHNCVCALSGYRTKLIREVCNYCVLLYCKLVFLLGKTLKLYTINIQYKKTVITV